ncbi:MAG: type II toxin-antitoxin system HicB family antitoxin [Phycisphaerae bacterium]|nr:type II toxin-antitoxin system HicB family antitoxin [Phycisphaerae bacterium]
MRFAVVIEKARNNYGAYVPDLPGCVATGKTRQAALREIRAAIGFHLDGLREDGLLPPKPSARAEYVEAGAVRRTPRRRGRTAKRVA